jgi:hypothetical protein
LHPLAESRPLAVWVYSAVLVCALVRAYFTVLLPLARAGELNMLGVILMLTAATAGILGFFIKRLWGIGLFAASEGIALSQVFGITLMNVVAALALAVPMVVVAFNYRSQFRIW